MKQMERLWVAQDPVWQVWQGVTDFLTEIAFLSGGMAPAEVLAENGVQLIRVCF